MNGKRRARDIVLHVGLAVGAFVAVAAVIRPLVPWPLEYGLRAKVEYFRDHRGEFDTVYIGSSNTHRSYVPAVIDADVATRGILQRSFNLGVNGMGFYETNNMMEELLAERPARLRTVCLEALSCSPKTIFGVANIENRNVFWHTPAQTAKVLRAIAALDEPWTDRLGQCWPHVAMAARKLCNYAQGPRIVGLIDGDDAMYEYVTRADLEQRQGYQDPEVGHDEEEALARERFLKDLSSWWKQVREMDAGNRRRVTWSPTVEQLQVGQTQWLVSRGYRTVTVIPPAMGPAAEIYRMAEAGLIPVLLAYNSPERYRQLYRPEAHYDRGHLNRAGAEDFSHAFAQELAAHLGP